MNKNTAFIFWLVAFFGAAAWVFDLAVRHSKTLRSRNIGAVIHGVSEGNYVAFVQAQRWWPHLSRAERAAISSARADCLSTGRELHWSVAPWWVESRFDRLTRSIMEIAGFQDDPIQFRIVCVPAFQRVPPGV